MNIIETRDLTKVYTSSFGKKKVQALLDLNLSIEKGTIFGLLGPNGAGKTTLVKILLGITFPTTGKATVLKQSISGYRFKKQIGYLPENHKYPPYLTGKQVLQFFGNLSGVDNDILTNKIDELLKLVKLDAWRNTKVKAYSKGMMQRLGLAQAMVNDPDLVFLDEPTDGVDPIGRKEIRDILIKLKQKGKTIFLNSHLLSEVELITDRVGILNKGKLLREGTVKELTEKKEEFKLRLENLSDELIEDDKLKNYRLNKINENHYSANVLDSKDLNNLIDILRSEEIIIYEITPQKSTLEDMFLSLIEKADSEVVK